MRLALLVLVSLAIGWSLGAGWSRAEAARAPVVVPGPASPASIERAEGALLEPGTTRSAPGIDPSADVSRAAVTTARERAGVREKPAAPPPPTNLLEALRRAIDAGWVAQYEEQHSGWLAQQVLAIYREVGLFEQAIDIVGHDQVPEQTLRELARARADAGDIAGAIQIYRARLDEDPGDSHALHGLRSTDPDALCTFLQGRLAEVGPDARLEMSLGHTLVLAGRMEEALAIAQRYLSDDADELRGWYLYERIDPEAALEHARRRADSDPAWGPALAGALEERGDEEGATLALTSCLEHGRNEDAIDLLGDLDPARAADYLGAWSLANPYDVELQVRWAEALVDAEDAGGAVDVLAQLIARDPRDPDREAASKLLDMDAPRFFASVRPAVESSGDASAWWDLARWYEEADDVEEQRAALDRAIELNPWNQRYRNAREDLD